MPPAIWGQSADPPEAAPYQGGYGHDDDDPPETAPYQGGYGDDDDDALRPAAYPDYGCRRESIGAGYLVLVARELTGLSQSKLAERVRTSQPALARIETGNRVPTVRTLMRICAAAGFELLLGLREIDSDPPRPDLVDGVVLLGALLPAPDDDLADFVVFKEPSVFDGPGVDT